MYIIEAIKTNVIKQHSATIRILFMLIVTIVAITACTAGNASPTESRQNEHLQDGYAQTESPPQAAEPPTEISPQTAESSSVEAAPNTSSTTTDIASIPFFGNPDTFNLPAAHALAYAEAIQNAGFGIDSLHFRFDTFYPVLIDISGDGVPLLLLVEKADHTAQWGDLPLHPNLLFGFADGELQRITQFMAVGTTQKGDETLLTIGAISDFGGSYNFYRVHYGAAIFDSTMLFVADWHGGVPHGEININGEILSPEDYWAILETIPEVSLIEQWHPGNVVVSSALEPYLMAAFTRGQAVQMFLDHAERG